MSNPSKAKGTRAEGEVLRWLIGVTGWPLQRHALHGTKDVGDIWGVPDTVIEVKSGHPHTREWLRELAAEQVNAEAAHAFVVWRTPMTTDPAQWVVLAHVGNIGNGLWPRHPIPGPSSQLANYVRACAPWTPRPVGFRHDGRMATTRGECDAVAMTGAGFEYWLHENINPEAYNERPADLPIDHPDADGLGYV